MPSQEEVATEAVITLSPAPKSPVRAPVLPSASSTESTETQTVTVNGDDQKQEPETNSTEHKENTHNTDAISEAGSVVVETEIEKKDASPAPELSSSAVAPPAQKKKRLTLAERLALAAAKGGKKTQKKSMDVSAEATPRTSTEIQEDIDVDKLVASTNEEVVASAEPATYETLDREALIELLKSSTAKYNDLVTADNNLKAELASKDNELKLKKTEISKLSQSSSSPAISKKLQEKEQVIKELMEEGSKLSMKELQLSETIKRLKSKSRDDSELLSELQEKLDISLQTIATYEAKESELKDFESQKTELITNLRELESKHGKLTEEYSKVNQQFKDLKSQRFEQQLESTKRRLEDETAQRTKLESEVDELKIRLKLTKDESKHEITELEETIKKEKKRYQALEQENANEIRRLEEKMESWRAITEGSTKFNDSDANNESVKKLTSSYELLQSQYTASQENWKLIESSYLNKISQAEQDMNTFKQKDIASNKKIKALISELKSKTEELEEALDRESILTSQLGMLEENIDKLQKEMDKSQKRIISLEQEFETAKVEHETKLKDELNKLSIIHEKEIEKLNNRSFDGPVNQQALFLNDLLPNPSYLKTRSTSNYSINDNIAFGESSTTPRSTHPNTRKPSSAVLNQQYFSSNSSFRTPLVDSQARFFESPKAEDSPRILDESYNSTQDDLDPFEEEFAEDYNNHNQNNGASTIENSPSSNHSSRFTLNKEAAQTLAAPSTIGSLPGGTTNKNIQIMGKLSSQIRRLEVESATLRDEVSNLNKEKKEANDEIVKLLAENSEVASLKSERQALEERLSSLDRKYERTLEILGEKSEKVEELTADVADLKELCKQQVQALVELQTK